MTYLTKSRFKLGRECPRKLYYGAHPETYCDNSERDEFLKALADSGNQVGALAQCHWLEGRLVGTLDRDDALRLTDALLKHDKIVIFEAAIRFEQFFIRIDVLVKDGNAVDLIEAKAKSWDGDFCTKRGKIRSKWIPYLEDVAFQTWVARQAHPEWLVTPYLMLVDKLAKATTESLNQLFRITRRKDGRAEVQLTDEPTAERIGRSTLAQINVDAEVSSILEGDYNEGVPLGDEAGRLAQIVRDDRRSPFEIGVHCRACEYRCYPCDLPAGLRSGFDECWAEKLGEGYDPNEPNILDLWNFRGAADMLSDGVWRLVDVAPESLNERQARQVKLAYGEIAEEWYDPQILEVIEGWSWPLHFVDFETIAPAIPFHRGMHPYDTVAFQFSRHTMREDGTIEHDEFLAEGPDYPGFRFLGSLRSSLGEHGTLIHYAVHERSVLNHLVEQVRREELDLPDDFDIEEMTCWAETLNTGDMRELVLSHYQHRRMGGSNSIKAVLPAVMASSKELERRYGVPLGFGTRLRGKTVWQRDESTGEICDPYDLLPPMFTDIDRNKLAHFEGEEGIRAGGAAMIAWARTQFSDMGDEERKAVREALLRYCELDTLAMVMIYQHWVSLKPT